MAKSTWGKAPFRIQKTDGTEARTALLGRLGDGVTANSPHLADLATDQTAKTELSFCTGYGKAKND